MKIGGEAEEGRDGGVFSRVARFAPLPAFHYGACELLALKLETFCILMVPASCKICRNTRFVFVWF